MFPYLLSYAIRRSPRLLLVFGVMLVLTSAPPLILDVADGQQDFRVTVTPVHGGSATVAADVQYSALPSETQRTLDTALDEETMLGGDALFDYRPRGLNSGDIVEYDHYRGIEQTTYEYGENESVTVPAMYYDADGDAVLSNTFKVTITPESEDTTGILFVIIRLAIGLVIILAYFDTHR